MEKNGFQRLEFSRNIIREIAKLLLTVMVMVLKGSRDRNGIGSSLMHHFAMAVTDRSIDDMLLHSLKNWVISFDNFILHY